MTYIRIFVTIAGPHDTWYAQHQANCDGTFMKVSEPEKQDKVKIIKKRKQLSDNKTNNKSDTITNHIDSYFMKPGTKHDNIINNNSHTNYRKFDTVDVKPTIVVIPDMINTPGDKIDTIDIVTRKSKPIIKLNHSISQLTDASSTITNHNDNTDKIPASIDVVSKRQAWLNKLNK